MHIYSGYERSLGLKTLAFNDAMCRRRVVDYMHGSRLVVIVCAIAVPAPGLASRST